MPQISIDLTKTQPRKVLYGVAFAAVFGLLAILAAIGFFAVPSADDFCNADRYTKHGFWGAQSDLYLNWGGRYASNAAIVAFIALIDLRTLYGLVGALAHLLTFAAFLLLAREILRDWTSLPQQCLAAGVAAIIFFSGVPDPAQTYYWLSGTLTYQLGNVALILMTALLIRAERAIARHASALFSGLAAACCALVAAGANETSMLLALLILGAGALASMFLRRPATGLWIALTVVALAGTAAAVLAPGNFARMDALDSTGLLRPSLWGAALLYLPWVGLRMAYWLSNAGLWAAVLLLFVATHSRVRNALFQSGSFNFRWFAVPLAWIGGLLVLNLLGFVVNRYPLPERAESVVYLLFLLGWFPTALIVSHYLLGNAPAPSGRLAWSAPVAVLAISLAGSPNVFEVYKDSYRGYRYWKEMQVRFAALELAQQSGDRDPVVTSISRPPRTLFATELTTDPANFRNVCMAGYFGLQSVRLGSKP